MNYISVTEAAVTMNVSVKILRKMCERGMIKGAIRFGRIWAIQEECCRAKLFQRRSYPWVKSNEKTRVIKKTIFKSLFAPDLKLSLN